MKLKKLASLAMSGVLCVSMLAACGGGSSSSRGGRFVARRGRIRFGGVRLRFGGGDGQRYSRG